VGWIHHSRAKQSWLPGFRPHRCASERNGGASVLWNRASRTGRKRREFLGDHFPDCLATVSTVLGPRWDSDVGPSDCFPTAQSSTNKSSTFELDVPAARV